MDTKLFNFAVTSFRKDGSILEHRTAVGQDFDGLIKLIGDGHQMVLDDVKDKPIWKKHVTENGTLVQYLGKY